VALGEGWAVKAYSNQSLPTNPRRPLPSRPSFGNGGSGHIPGPHPTTSWAHLHPILTTDQGKRSVVDLA